MVPLCIAALLLLAAPMAVQADPIVSVTLAVEQQGLDLETDAVFDELPQVSARDRARLPLLRLLNASVTEAHSTCCWNYRKGNQGECTEDHNDSRR